MEIQLLKITDKVFVYYQQIISSNKNISRDLIERKLTRNMLMAIPMKKTKNGLGTVYSYGNMRFMVSDNTVEWIENDQEKLPMWYKDKVKHKELNKQLNIYSEEAKQYNVGEILEMVETVRRKTKRVKNARAQVFHLKSKVMKTIGENEDNKWLIDHIDAIYQILENDDKQDTIWNS